MNESDFDATTSRDTEKEVEQVYYQLQREFFWVHLGEQGDRISAVLSGIAADNEIAEFKAWKKHLTDKLTFPFQAKVAEWQETGPLECDELVTVYRIVATEEIDTDHGLFVEITNQKNRYLFPLSDLEVADKQSKNFTPVKDYVVWFANR